MILLKKITAVLVISAIGLVGFGFLPKAISDRLTRALIAFFIVGFCIRVGAYLLSSQ
jgi:hypothetical protein